MASVIRLDTHVVVWLYAGRDDQLSGRAIELIDQNVCVVSPMVELELTYLNEIGRLTASGADILADLDGRIGLKRSDERFAAVVAAAASAHWTHDPFDRLIVGDASASGCQLVTKDAHIRENFSLATW